MISTLISRLFFSPCTLSLIRHLCSVPVDARYRLLSSRVPIRHVNNVFIMSRVLLGLPTDHLSKLGRCYSHSVVFCGLNAIFGGLACGEDSTRVLVEQCLKDAVAILRSDAAGQDTF